jgi:putative membrane protein insertion efficiency factor
VKSLILSGLRFYKARISPQLPPACRYTPTCSEYAIDAIERRGVLVGGFLAAKRVISCNPFSRGGYDPVREAHR